MSHTPLSPTSMAVILSGCAWDPEQPKPPLWDFFDTFFTLVFQNPGIFVMALGLGLWLTVARVKRPAVAAFNTWLLLTLAGMTITYMALITSVGVGHGRGGLGMPIILALCTLVLPWVAAFKVKEARTQRASETAPPEGP